MSHIGHRFPFKIIQRGAVSALSGSGAGFAAGGFGAFGKKRLKIPSKTSVPADIPDSLLGWVVLAHRFLSHENPSVRPKSADVRQA